MSGGAWIMLICTWSVVLFFTARFLLKVLRSPGFRGDAANADAQAREPDERAGGA